MRTLFLSAVICTCLVFQQASLPAQWVLTNSPNNVHLAVYPKSDAPSGWCILASLPDSGIITSKDNGNSWSVLTRSFTSSVIRVSVEPSQTTILVGNYDDGVSTSSDEGVTWIKANEGLTTPWVLDLFVDRTPDTTFLFAATHPVNGTPGGLYRSTNLGGSWTQAGTPDAPYVTRVTGDLSHIWIGTYFGGIWWSSIQSGSSWMPWSTGLSRYAYVTGLANCGSAFIAAADSNGPLPQRVDTFGVFKSTSFGSSWSQVTSGLSSHRVRNLLWTGGPLFMTTNSGVYYSTNAGTAWNPFSYGMGNTIPSDLSFNGKYLLASSSLGVWRRPITDLPAILWLPQAAPAAYNIFGLSFATPDTGWAVGPFGLILKTTDGGSSWLPQASGTKATLTAVSFVDKLTGWAVGTGGTILHTTNGGALWTGQQVGSTEFRAVSFATHDTGWVVGHIIGMAGVVLKTTDGSTWTQQASSSTGLWAVYALSTQTVCAAGGYTSNINYYKTFLRTTDGGKNWSNTTSSGPTILSVAFGDAQTGLAVGETSVMKTADGGITWTFAASAPTYLSAVCFADKLHAWAVGASGLILAMTPGGEFTQVAATAENLSAVTFVAGMKGWIGGSNGTILKYRSPSQDVVPDIAADRPQTSTLLQNYPNPFNPSTTICYELPKSCDVRLSVYDILGREVSVLVNETKNPGVYEVKFDATGLSSGVYFYRLIAGDFQKTRSLLLLK